MDITKPIEAILSKIPVGLFLLLFIAGILYFFVPAGVENFFASIFDTVRPIFIVVDALLLFTLIFAINRGLANRPVLVNKPVKEKRGKRKVQMRKQFIAEQWAAISSKFSEGTPEAYKIAIIDADRLADWILRAAGVKGEHMADRLEKISASKLSTLDQLWRAHRVRNEVVHSPDFDLPARLAEQTLRDYEAFLREVKAL